MLISTQLLRQPRMWVLTGCGIFLVIFFFAITSDGVSYLPLPIHRNERFNIMYNGSDMAKDLLHDVSNSTLGVSLLPMLRISILF